MNYRKRFTDASGAYVIEEIRRDGRVRVVDEAQMDYIYWLADGNELEEIAYVPPPPEPVPTLAEVKAAKKLEITEARYAAETGGMAANGMEIDTSRESQSLITGAALQATIDPAYSCKWKTAQGFIELSAQQVIGAAVAVRQHVQSCFDREAELYALIDSKTTKAKVQAITWNSAAGA
jgi:hypothetical protein